MSTKKESVLVTGGAGFIGSHLAEALLARGYRVRVLDNLSQGQRDWVPSDAEFIEGDITSVENCNEACAGMTGVFHLAAMSRVAPSLDNIEGCTNPNVIGTQNILTASRTAGVRRLVYSGSSTFYGNTMPPHTEDMPAEFLNFYSLTKAVGEQYCFLFDKLYGLSTAVVRYFNVYGPRQPQTGAYALVIGIFLKRLAMGLPIVIHGDGSQRRDFVHVKDAAEATIRVFESDARAEVFNVGSGTNVSIKEIADLISAEQEFGPRRAGDAKVTLADISKIQAKLGWKPRVSFEEGLQELIQLTQSQRAASEVG
jgi:nucleoside-diphosphate-sugar epimerase